MRTIDADYLIKNINDWKDLLTDEKERAILEQVVHCIEAKDTVIDIRKLIQN